MTTTQKNIINKGKRKAINEIKERVSSDKTLITLNLSMFIQAGMKTIDSVESMTKQKVFEFDMDF